MSRFIREIVNARLTVWQYDSGRLEVHWQYEPKANGKQHEINPQPFGRKIAVIDCKIPLEDELVIKARVGKR